MDDLMKGGYTPRTPTRKRKLESATSAKKTPKDTRKYDRDVAEWECNALTKKLEEFTRTKSEEIRKKYEEARDAAYDGEKELDDLKRQMIEKQRKLRDLEDELSLDGRHNRFRDSMLNARYDGLIREINRQNRVSPDQLDRSSALCSRALDRLFEEQRVMAAVIEAGENQSPTKNKHP